MSLRVAYIRTHTYRRTTTHEQPEQVSSNFSRHVATCSTHAPQIHGFTHLTLWRGQIGKRPLPTPSYHIHNFFDHCKNTMEMFQLFIFYNIFPHFLFSFPFIHSLFKRKNLRNEDWDWMSFFPIIFLSRNGRKKRIL